MYSAKTSKTHPNCEVWCRDHHGLWWLCCLRACTACYDVKKEIPSLSGHFGPPIEVQWELGNVIGQ